MSSLTGTSGIGAPGINRTSNAPPNSANSNVLLSLNKFNVVVAIIVLGLIITSLLAIFEPNIFNSYAMPLTPNQQAINAVIIVLFALIVIVLMVMFIPSMKNVYTLSMQLYNVGFVVLYTIFLILLFRLIPTNTLNKYAYIITPLTLAGTIYLFYKSFKTNYVKQFSVNYERIKMIVLFFCFITTLFIYYSSDPGGYIKKYFGSSLILTILISFFAFLYIIVLLLLPENAKLKPQQKQNFLSNFTNFSVYGTTVFIIYLIIVTIGMVYMSNGFSNAKEPTTTTKSSDYIPTSAEINTMFDTSNDTTGSAIEISFTKPNAKGTKFDIPLPTTVIENSSLNIPQGFNLMEGPTTVTTTTSGQSPVITEGFTTSDSSSNTDKQSTMTVAIIFILLTCIIMGSSLIINLFPEGVVNYPGAATANVTKITLFKRSLLVIFGIILSGMLIAWLVYNLQNLSSDSSILSFVLNTLLILVVLTLIYKIFYVKLPAGNSNKQGFFDLIFSLVLYIPCLFSSLMDSITGAFTGNAQASNASSVLLVIVAIGLIIAYFKLPSLEKSITLQGGTLLVNKPISSNIVSTLASYEQLNGNNDNKYQYGLSFWFFIDAMPPNTNASYNTYTSLLNYGNKPNISYNPTENTLKITMETYKIINPGQKPIVEVPASDLEETTLVLYEQKGIKLQKWNNLVINYNGGTLDVFLNNELVKSVIGISPYMTLDTLTVGSDDGIIGGICNVVYFKTPLTITNMYYLYNMVKNGNPPISDKSDKTIISLTK